MAKLDIQEEIRRITSQTAADAASKALEVAELAKTKAAEVSTLAIAEALKAATLAATKAADAASAASTIAASTSKDLEYIKKDIADTKNDIKEIKEKLDNKYVNKEEFGVLEKAVGCIAIKVDGRVETYSQFSTVKNLVYGTVGIILTAVLTSIVYLVVRR